MTYTIDRVEYYQNEDQTIRCVRFRLEDDELFGRFWVELTWRGYLDCVKEGNLIHLFEQRIQQEKDTLAAIDAIKKEYLNKEIGI